MLHLNAVVYREREAQWREEAAKRTRGQEQAACLALAEGYADLAKLTEAMSSAHGASTQSDVTDSARSIDPERSTSGNQEIARGFPRLEQAS
jgi:hypothetical protein